MTHIPRVTLYHATDCSLCARAVEVAEAVRDELGFELALVDIGGVPELEARYRELLPAIEVDGELAFTYFVDAEALRTRARAVPPASPEGRQAES
ncbi:MAG TPA: glutaredoxin family protein [Gaiellaceae bacterium]|nr:glutaredoxin family protein [Gaiellaceae bacterium]